MIPMDNASALEAILELDAMSVRLDLTKMIQDYAKVLINDNLNLAM